ncbi:MAG: hypothetical protein ACI8T1_001622 [Verrucomicrobiales bacterium]|jgi:hypothetical protein
MYQAIDRRASQTSPGPESSPRPFRNPSPPAQLLVSPPPKPRWAKVGKERENPSKEMRMTCGQFFMIYKGPRIGLRSLD